MRGQQLINIYGPSRCYCVVALCFLHSKIVGSGPKVGHLEEDVRSRVELCDLMSCIPVELMYSTWYDPEKSNAI